MTVTEKHSSKSFDNDLNETIKLFSLMGALAADQVTKATRALMEEDDELAVSVIMKDDEIDDLEVSIDEKVVLLFAKRQPAANDLRLVMALSKGVVDLERVGDESAKVAQMARQLIKEGSSPRGSSPRGYSEVQHLSNQVRLMLLEALDAFTHMNATQALGVLQGEGNVDREYQSASRSLMTYIMEDSRHISKVINILWVLRALERVGDHARNIAEYVIYCTSGKDVRHTDFGSVKQTVQQTSDNLANRKKEQ